MNVSKTVSISLNDLLKIQMYVNEGKISSVSEFVQIAVQKQLNEMED